MRWQFPRIGAALCFPNEWANPVFARSLPDPFLPPFHAFPLPTSRLSMNAASDRAENHLFLTIPRKRHLLRDETREAEKVAVLGLEVPKCEQMSGDLEGQ